MASAREYAILYIRGTRTGGTVIGGGNAVLGTGQHGLDGPEHTSLDAYVKTILAGQERKHDLGDVTGTATVPLALGNFIRANLTGACEFAIDGGVADYGLGFTVRLTGDFLATWDTGQVVTNDTDPATGVRFWVFVGDEGDAEWFGFLAGGGDSPTAVEILDEGVSLTATPTSIDYVGAGVEATAVGDAVTVTIPGGATASDVGIWRPLMDPATGDVITDATTGEAIMAFGPA